MTVPPLLSMRGIVKRFGAVTALDEVTFELQAGEIHALVGENGAGKSTLMKVLAGAFAADAGEVIIDGRTVRFDSPAASQAQGVGMIPQELSLVPALSVAENILLGHEPRRPWLPVIDRVERDRRARAALAFLGLDLDLETPVGSLSIAHCQVVEIARALSRKIRILALDEPTAPLSGHETQRLFEVLRRLRTEGVGLIYISHRLEEIFQIADRITVLRDGKLIQTAGAGALDRSALIRLMVGRDLEGEFPRNEIPRGQELLRLEGVAAAGLQPIHFSLHRGEILGLAGLVGAGRSELVRALFGADPRTGGRIVFDGRVIDPRSPREAIDLGIGLLTEDRNRYGLIPALTVRENLTLAGLAGLTRGPFIRKDQEQKTAAEFVRRLKLRPPSAESPVTALSGGNRQKVVLGRWLLTRPKLLIFDEPTAGVDVGARAEIYQWICQTAAQGTGVIVVSSDLPELLGLCDRIVVMCEGALTGALSRAEATQERIMALATGGTLG